MRFNLANLPFFNQAVNIRIRKPFIRLVNFLIRNFHMIHNKNKVAHREGTFNETQRSGQC